MEAARTNEGSQVTDVSLVVEPDAEAAARAAAELLCTAARAGGALALAGGSTPRRAYELAAELEPDWGRARLWLGDERLVPPDDERSNRRLVSEALLARLAVQPTAYWVDTRLSGPDAAAGYAETLAGVSLDLVLLGLGGDGHTASLFPASRRSRSASRSSPPRSPVSSRGSSASR